MKKRIFISIFVLFLVIIISCFTFFVNAASYMKGFSATEDAEDLLILKEVSIRTGVNFSSIDSLRSYVYCKLIRKDMSYEEVKNSLSIVGELVEYDRSPKNQFRFVNKILDRNFGPIIVSFDMESGKLYEWRNSTTHNYHISFSEGT